MFSLAIIVRLVAKVLSGNGRMAAAVADVSDVALPGEIGRYLRQTSSKSARLYPFGVASPNLTDTEQMLNGLSMVASFLAFNLRPPTSPQGASSSESRDTNRSTVDMC